MVPGIDKWIIFGGNRHDINISMPGMNGARKGRFAPALALTLAHIIGFRIGKRSIRGCMAELNEDQRVTCALRTKLRERCAAARQDAIIFAVLTVLLTPVAFVVLIFSLIFAYAMIHRGWVDHLFYAQSFLAGVNLCLAFMGGAYYLRPKAKSPHNADDNSWTFAGVVIFCVIFALSYLTMLPTAHAALFWPLYLVLATVMLGCFGKAYEPRDDYYLGWTVGPFLMDDPFSFRDDIDRAHFSLGFASSVAILILESYGGVFGSRWLWSGLTEPELSDAAAVVLKLARQDFAGAKAQIHYPQSAVSIYRVLVKLELVSFDHCRLNLTVKGRDFVREEGR